MASTKRQNTISLANRIFRLGVEMSPCSRCASKGEACIVSADSPKCSGCVRAGRSCDVSDFSAAALDRVGVEEDRISDEEEKTFAALQEHQAKMELAARQAAARQRELSNRLIRLRRQKQLLRKRGAELLRRGLADLEGGVEEQAIEASSPVDLSFSFLDPLPDLSEADLAAFLAAGSSEVFAGTSSSS
jgi:hypothetical protein